MEIRWKLYLNSAPDVIFELLSTDGGRKKFWAESADEIDGWIDFIFSNGQTYRAKVLKSQSPYFYEIDYFNTKVFFSLQQTSNKGTDLTLLNIDVLPTEYCEIKAGWVSVLLALKAAADFGVDLRNHDNSKSWDQLYVDN